MVAINIRDKGANGEREVAQALEQVVRRVLRAGEYPLPDKPIIQRNQNQSAVGGSDLSNTFGLCIEVKRQEQLAINTWWQQCVTAARTNGETPVLLYRQNGKKWKCMVMAQLQLPMLDSDGSFMMCRVEIGWDDFLTWFEEWVRRQLVLGVQMRV